MAYEMPHPSAPDVGTFLDNADPCRTLGQHLQHAVPAAQRLCICTGYVSGQGLQFLAECLDQMDPHAEAQLLIGMPPRGWKYPPSTATAGATYLRSHLGADAGSLELEVWPRLAAQEEAGRLAAALAGPVPRHARQTLSLADGSRPLAGSQWQFQPDPFRAHRPR